MATTNNAAMNRRTHVPSGTNFIFFDYNPKRGVPGSYGISIFSF